MCPSYMVTREEKHSTRGRARLLFEMLAGRAAAPAAGSRRGGEGGARPLPGLQGLQERCPVQRGHGHLQGRVPLALLRGAAAAAARLRDGLIYWWARLGLARAGAGERVTHDARLSASLQVRSAAIAPRARRCRRSRRRRSTRGSRSGRRREPGQAAGDPLARHVQQPLPPETAKAAVEVLERAGFQVVDPARHALLRPAALRLRHARPGQALLRADPRRARGRRSRAGIAGRRPRAELRRRLPRRADEPLPDDEDAQRPRQQTYHAHRVPASSGDSSCRRSDAQGAGPRALPPQGDRGIEPRAEAARGDWASTSRSLDSGCCGMAGSFGFEAGHYDVSMSVRRAGAAARGARGATPTR